MFCCSVSPLSPLSLALPLTVHLRFIPVISEDKSVEVINFVRTPNYFMPRDQKTYSALTKTFFKYIPGYMRTYRNFIMATSDSRFIVWMLNAWGLRHYVEEVSLKYMRDTAPAKYHGFLTPRYPFGCKRGEFLSSFARRDCH
jgi:hypothetical protein